MKKMETFPIRESEHIASLLEMWQEGGAGRPSYSPPAINTAKLQLLRAIIDEKDLKPSRKDVFRTQEVGCFCILAIVNNAAVNTGVHVSFQISFFVFLGMYTKRWNCWVIR